LVPAIIVEIYTIEGMGHTWPGRENRLRCLGATTKNISANDAMWEFFQQHARK
jgi:polyhydroxybutyrate depolymerase